MSASVSENFLSQQSFPGSWLELFSETFDWKIKNFYVLMINIEIIYDILMSWDSKKKKEKNTF